jgi:ubiquinone/menaquinone biosynthesis C-methylase UbiE
MVRRRLGLCTLILLFVSAFAAAQDTWQKECTELGVLLQWHPGDTVADIGAGKGKLTSLAAERVGPSGRVYGTEMDLQSLVALQELSAKQTNITPVKASDSDTKLPHLSCDSIYMRLVYHHFTKPREMDSSLFQSLKHGGRLAIIDEEPRKGTTIPEGVPKNRLGHGIPQRVLIREVKHAGFQVQAIENDWPGGDAFHPMYCVIFLKR